MNSVKEHYQNHLGNFYSWMLGDFERKVEEELRFLGDQGVKPAGSVWALDLGAGHGIQSVALAKLGYQVKAIDFNPQLLSELKKNTDTHPVEVIEDDIRNHPQCADPKPELIICAGDTLSHLDSWIDIRRFLNNCVTSLAPGGLLVLTFRDYGLELKDHQRFIPVKSDENRILTCFLDYKPEKVIVTDLLHERNAKGWQQKISSYEKIRVTPQKVLGMLHELQLKIRYEEVRQGVVKIISERVNITE